jgi:hypothetical protein
MSCFTFACLQDAVGAQLKEFDLKDPNQLSTAEYNTYSAAAIGGTLALMLPGALIFDITGLIGDFLFGATIGGGLAAYLALRKDGIGEAANKFGATLGNAAGIDVPRISLPDAATSALNDLDLKNPNGLSTADYNTYSFAAIGGTLILMAFPGLLIFNPFGFVFDFLFGATIGGGLGAFLALRTDGIAEPVNKFGQALLDAADSVGEKLS